MTLKKFAAQIPYKNFWRALLKVVLLVAAIILVGKIFPTFAGTLLCLLLLGGYYGAIFYATRFCNVNFREMFLSDLPRILIVAAVSVMFIVLIVNAQQTIYIWDSLETWEPTIECSELTFTDPHQALKNLRGSINHTAYNNFLPMLMALPMHLFGKSFVSYVLYVWLMFALPGIFFAAATFKTFSERAGVKIFPVSILMALMILVPAQIVPLFVGYANVSILVSGALGGVHALGFVRGLRGVRHVHGRLVTVAEKIFLHRRVRVADDVAAVRDVPKAHVDLRHFDGVCGLSTGHELCRTTDRARGVSRPRDIRNIFVRCNRRLAQQKNFSRKRRSC